jgi:hypothetical protein
MTRVCVQATVVIAVLAFLGIGNRGASAQVQTAWEKEYTALNSKIDKEEPEPRPKGTFGEYLVWMERKAADRDKAKSLAAAASNAGNPYWEERFLDLVEKAEHNANVCINYAIGYYVTVGWQWMEAVERSNEYGGPLYQKAKALALDSNRVREAVRCNVRYALGDVESNSHNMMCLYRDRVVAHGTEKDAEGNWRMPRMDFDIYCLPRSAFHPEAEGEVNIDANEGLRWVEEIREVCRSFDLFEINEATDLMNEFLKDALCLSGRKDLGWYLSLAEKYQLGPAADWIKGFYGTVYGTVYLKEGTALQPAPGAKVTIWDLGREISATADAQGGYMLPKAPLCGRYCTPIRIGAVYKGRSTEDKYAGMLEQPDPKARQEKNLTILGGDWRWTGTVAIEVLEQANCSLDESDKKSTKLFYEHEETIQVATMQVAWGKDDILQKPVDALAGSFSANLSNLRQVSSNSPIVQIQGTLYGGGYMLEKSTLRGNGLQALTAEIARIEITRDFESMEGEIERLGKLAGAGDMKALEQMNALLSGEPANGEQLLVHVIITPDQKMTAESTELRETKSGLNPKKIERNDRNQSSMLIPGLAMEFRAKFVRDPNGRHRIEGSSSVPEKSRSGTKPKCPDAMTTRIGNIRLERVSVARDEVNSVPVTNGTARPAATTKTEPRASNRAARVSKRMFGSCVGDLLIDFRQSVIWTKGEGTQISAC